MLLLSGVVLLSGRNKPNEGQEKIINAAIDWYYHSDEQVFEFSGGPGRGKSFVLNLILEQLQLGPNSVAPMTFTGAAAINMRRKGMFNAKTAHSWLYEPIEVPLVKCGKIVMDYRFNRPVMTRKFVPKQLDPSIELCIVDEGGSVPYSIANEIRDQKRKILVTGDIDQLPPVGEPRGFLFDPDIPRLTENMRQYGCDNGIEYLSQRALHGLPLHVGYYGNAVVITKSTFNKCPDLYLANMDVVICNRNKTRDEFTEYCRGKRGVARYKLPTYGEPLVCKENVWDIEVDGINLVNGLRGVVTSCPNAGCVNMKDKVFTMDFMPDNMNQAFLNINADYRYINLLHDGRQAYKEYESKYSTGVLFEYGYAITSYSSQGSEYKNVLYIQEPMNKNLDNTFDYVAITRARDFLVVVLSDG